MAWGSSGRSSLVKVRNRKSQVPLACLRNLRRKPITREKRPSSVRGSVCSTLSGIHSLADAPAISAGWCNRRQELLPSSDGGGSFFCAFSECFFCVIVPNSIHSELLHFFFGRFREYVYLCQPERGLDAHTPCFFGLRGGLWAVSRLLIYKAGSYHSP